MAYLVNAWKKIVENVVTDVTYKQNPEPCIKNKECIIFDDTIKTSIKKFLETEVSQNTINKYPIQDEKLYSRLDYSKWEQPQWDNYFESFQDLYRFIMNNNLLQSPSQLFPTKKIYRASEFYDPNKKKHISLPGKCQPLWYGTDEEYSLKYINQTPDKTGKKKEFIAFTLMDKINESKKRKLTTIDIRFLNLDGDEVPNCQDVYLLNVELMRKLYAVVKKQIDFKNNELFYNAYGYRDGIRSSEYVGDRIITIEFMIIFKMMNDFILTRHKTPILILGYYHSDISFPQNYTSFPPIDVCESLGAEVTINADIINDEENRVVENKVYIYKFYTNKRSIKSQTKGGNKARKTRKKRSKKPILYR